MLKFAVLFLVSLFCLPAAAAQRLHLVTVALPPIAPGAGRPGFADQVAREAFRRIGVEIEVSVLPGERALMNVNAGLDDGDLLRAPAIEKDYPNLIRVPEKMMDFEFVGYAMFIYLNRRHAALAPKVETQAQHDFLGRHGCPNYQGHLFGKPVPLAEFEILLLKKKRGGSQI